MNAGDVVTVVQRPNAETSRWKAKTKYGTGWIDPNGFELVTEHIIPDNSNAIEEVQSPWTITDQYFRIYETSSSLSEIKVSARHISYDLLYNLTSYKTENSVKLQDALNGILGGCYSSHEFSAFTNVENERVGLFYENKNPIDSFLNLEDGICAKYDVALVRDNYELFFLKDPGMNRGVRIQYSKNMLGVEFASSDDEVVTKIIPVGETSSGEPLYLDSDASKRGIDSQYLNAYPVPHVYELKCENCKVGEKDSSGGKITVAIARERMKKQAEDMLENGCDEPKISMKVEFINLGDTEEYVQFKNLENSFLFDYVIVQHPTLYYKDISGTIQNIDVTARIVSIDWDCILERMLSVEIGQVGITMANTGISSWQIPNGFSGSKIGYGSINGGALAANVISAKHIQSQTINAEHLNAEEITAFVVNAMTIKVQDLVAKHITTDELYAALAEIAIAEITTANIERANIDWAAIETLTAGIATLARAEITDANIQRADINWANIISAHIGEARIDWADIERLNAAVAQIADARIRSATISTAQIDQLSATVAEAVTLTVRTGTFDYASVENLLAQAMVLRQGVAGTISINNLLVTSANLLNATVGELVLKGEDGKYYQVNVDSAGELTAAEVTVSAAEIAAGQTSTGRQIVETNMNVAALNATELMAQTAAIGDILTLALTAEKITAGQALLASATVPTLYTTAIRAIGDTLDISANSSIRLLVGDIDAARKSINGMMVGTRNYVRYGEKLWWDGHYGQQAFTMRPIADLCLPDGVKCG